PAVQGDARQRHPHRAAAGDRSRRHRLGARAAGAGAGGLTKRSVRAIPPARPAAAAAVVAFAIALSATLALAGCRRYAMPPADATYDTRGQVVEVPRDAGGELVVHHEAVAG